MSADDWLCFTLGLAPTVILFWLAWFEEAHGHRIRREQHMPRARVVVR